MNTCRWLQRAGLMVAIVSATGGLAPRASAQITTTWQSGNWLTGTWSNGVAGPNDTAVIGTALTMNVSGTVKQVIMGMTNSNQSLTIANGGSFVVDGGLGEFNAGANTGSIVITQTNAAAANLIQAASVRARGLTVSSTSASTTAYLTIAAGQLYSPNNGSTPNGNVLISSAADRNGQITLSGTLDAANMTLGVATGSGTAAFILDGGSLSLVSITRGAGGTASFDFRNGRLAARSASTLVVTSNAATPLQVALGDVGSRTIDSNGGLVTMLPNSRFVDGTGAGSLTKSGVGTLVLQAANTYTGDTVIASGTLRLENAAQQVLSGTVGGSGNRTISGLASTAGLFIGQAVTGSGIAANSCITGITGSSVTLNYAGTPGAVSGTFAAANGSLQGSTLVYDNQGGVLSFGQSTSVTLGGLEGSQNLALTNAANAAVALTLGGNGRSTSYSGVLSGAGSLTKTGAGSMTLGSANTFSGDTTISFGTLKLASGGSFANSGRIIVGGSGSTGVALDLTEKSNFTIGASQTLMGGGSVNLGAGTVFTVSGTFSPGNSPGLFTYSSGTTVLDGTTVMEIWGTNRATSPSHADGFYDAVNVTSGGVLDFGGGILELSFDSLFNDGDSFQLFQTLDTASLEGNFDGVTVTGSYYTGLTWTKTGSLWESTPAGGGESLAFNAATGTLAVFVVVPEPGAVALAGIGIGIACWTLRKRRHVGSPAPQSVPPEHDPRSTS